MNNLTKLNPGDSAISTKVSEMATLHQLFLQNPPTEILAIQVDIGPNGDVPFETRENEKGDSISAEVRLTRETAISIALLILKDEPGIYVRDTRDLQHLALPTEADGGQDTIQKSGAV